MDGTGQDEIERDDTGLDDTRLDDATRMAALRRYDLLGGRGPGDLDSLVELAALVADVPMATINLITDSEQHQIAAVGFDAAVCTREDSMCAAVLSEPEPVVVADASIDPRFAANPFVTGRLGDVRFYASFQLLTPDGVPIGSLCIFDTAARTITPEREDALRVLAARVVDLLELHLRTQELTFAVEALEATRVELTRSNEHLTAFAGQVSHDLRSPLTAVSTALRMLADEIDENPAAVPEEDVEFLLRRAMSGASRMQSLIDGLLSFARFGGELRTAPTDLATLMDDVRADLGDLLEGAVLEAHDLPSLTGDPVHLRALLQNLVANAVKFTRPLRAPHVVVRAERVGGCWRVEIQDNGPGVPAEQRASVFRPLVRLGSTVAGSGIGLATCRRIVEAHGGTIGLADSPYGGATAWFELPAEAPVRPAPVAVGGPQDSSAPLSESAATTRPALSAVNETSDTPR
ncbi:hypothetical protein GCM10009737_07800 [Nocardioides lentus]|uniref:Sensor-like histidine kinase SenX3 n=1 Tax=Nocardioides lentus TaxID=338077 RepID=A0ABP5AC49_9ACTN